MANGHGGKRAGAGRPRKPLSDKILEDDLKKHKAKVLNFEGAEEQCINPPDYAFYYTSDSKDGGPDVTHLYQDTVEFLKTTGCLHLINPGFIMEYALLKARWFECERVISATNVVVVNAQKNGLKANGAAELGLKYLRQADLCWDKIWAIVTQNCEETYGGDNPNADLMEKLLKMNLGG